MMTLSNKPVRALLVFILLIGGNVIAQPNSCWLLHFDGIDNWLSYPTQRVSKVVRVADGFIVGGATDETIFPSKDGDTVGRTTYGGIFIAKYDLGGNLQWLDYGIDDTYGYGSPLSTIDGLAADPEGNIYFSGSFPSNDTFYCDGGQHAVVIGDNLSNGSGVIVKLDTGGHVLWQSQVDGNPWFLSYAANGRLVVSGAFGTDNPYYTTGGDWNNAVAIGQVPFWSSDAYQFILWIDTANGELVNHSDFRQTVANATYASDMTTDAESNIIFTGRFEYAICFYTPGHTDSMTMGAYNIAYEWPRMYTVKLDSAGVPLWQVSDRRTWPGSGPQGGSYSFDVTTAPNGTIYLNSYELMENANTTGYFYNPDSSIVTYKRRENHLLCLTKDGFFKWVAVCGYGSMMGFMADSNSVLVAGNCYGSWTSNIGITDTTFSANDSSYLHIPLQTAHMALIRFDTLGNVIEGSRLGIHVPTVSAGGGGIVQGDSGSVLIYGDVSSQVLPMGAWYSDTLYLHGTDGFVIKTTPGYCDSMIYPTNPYLGVTAQAASQKGFVLSPNPAQNTFTISGDWRDVSSVEIRNMLGMQVYQEAVTSSSPAARPFNLPHLPPGIYIVRLRGMDEDVSLKLIKE